MYNLCVRTIIAGSRTITSMDMVEKAIDASNFKITEVVSGGARGVDSLGEQWAREHGIPVKVFPAHWDLWGKSAGYRRNVEMAMNADALIAVWSKESKGTKHMIDIVTTWKLQVFVYKEE